MKIKILCLGKTKQKFIKEGIDEYLKRFSAKYKIEFIILPDVKLTKNNSIDFVKRKEAEILEKHISIDDFMVILDENGRNFRSVEFAEFLKKRENKNICFVIGGVYGLDETIKKKANLILSFSAFTFTHQIIRLLLIEQLYRAITIIEGKKYHY
ncbi:MAG: hypothetical protein B6D62_03820 [Candidatus Cloacimonas sp. 4484_275]|nr:MAG: hypothetical protein B6D62_03820 [Candidatus Cloacimonas sp. 4484_275]